MKLYHFTSGYNLRAIARFGLTVGDVPTNLATGAGRVAVWLTSASDPSGHGLAGGRYDKKRFRLEVEVSFDDPKLYRWAEWATANVTPQTISSLRRTAEINGKHQDDTWFVYFGSVAPQAIVEVVDLQDGTVVERWCDVWPADSSAKGVPYWRRHAWHKRMLEEVRRASIRMARAA